MNRLVLTVVVMLTLAASLFGCANQIAQTSNPWSLEKAVRLPSHELARNFLIAAEWSSVVAGQLRMVFSFARVVDIPVNVTTFDPDGTAETVTLATRDELEQLITKYERLHKLFKKAVMQRGFKQLALSYDATVSPGCSDRWFTSGEVTIKQNEFLFEVFQEGEKLSAAAVGAVVEDGVAIKTPANYSRPHGEDPGPPVVQTGKYGKTIELRDAQSTCKTTLRERR